MRLFERLVLFRVLLLAGVGLLGSAAQADILFLDLNNNPKEIEAAQRAALARGEKLIVRPLIPADVRKRTNEATSKYQRFERQVFQACSSNGSQARCQALRSQFQAVIDEYSAALRGVPTLDEKSLSLELSKLKNEKAKLSSLIVSGHDGNGHFGGSQGDLSDKAIEAAFKANAPIGDSIRSVLLWGCYTTNLGALEFHWKGLFPNANMIAGYDDRAPLGDKPANWAYLEDVLKKEKKLTEAKDQKEMQKIFKTIAGVDQVHSAVCLRNDEVVTLQKVSSIREEMAKCKPPDSDEQQKKFYCYMKAEPGCEDLPKDTGSGPIREYYNYLQATKHCQEILTRMGIRRPSTDTVLRLIFDRQVRENFERVYKQDIQSLNDQLKKSGFADDLRLGDLSKMTRKEYLDKMQAIKSALNAKMERAQGPEQDGLVEDVEMLTASNLFNSLSVAQSQSGCVPFSWVEPNATQPSLCMGPPGDSLKRARTFAEVQALDARLQRIVKEVKSTSSKFEETQRAGERANAMLRQATEERDLSRLPGDTNEPLLQDRQAPSAATALRRAEQRYWEAVGAQNKLESEQTREIGSQVLQRLQGEMERAQQRNATAEEIDTIRRYMEEWENIGGDATPSRVRTPAPGPWGMGGGLGWPGGPAAGPPGPVGPPGAGGLEEALPPEDLRIRREDEHQEAPPEGRRNRR